MPGPQLHNIAIKLLQREGGARPPKLFTKVPASFQTPIEDILDPAHELKSCVLLGFTRDGNHLVSYTSTPVAAADGCEGYCLQLWTFQGPQPCRKLWNVPVLRSDSSLEQPDVDDEFSTVPDALSLTVAETPGGELLVVHGRPSVDGGEGDRLANHLTILPGPQYADTAQQLQVVHLTYHTAAPHPPFNPYMSILHQPCPLDSLANGRQQVSLAFNLGDGVHLLRLTIAASAGQPCRQNAPGADDLQAGEQQRDGPSALISAQGALREPLAPGASTRLAASSGTFSQCQQQLEQPHNCEACGPTDPPGGPPHSDLDSHGIRSGVPCVALGRSSAVSAAEASGLEQLRAELNMLEVTTVTCWGSSVPASRCLLDSPCLSNGSRDGLGLTLDALPSPTADGGEPAASAEPACCSPGRLASARAVPAGPAVDWEEFLFSAVQQLGLSPRCLQDYGTALVTHGMWQERMGLIAVALLQLRGQQKDSQPLCCVLIHVAACTGRASIAEVLDHPFPWQGSLRTALQRSQLTEAAAPLSRVAAFAAEWLRGRLAVPSRREQLPYVLTNGSVLLEGRSLRYIAHPLLPQCILGYRQS